MTMPLVTLLASERPADRLRAARELLRRNDRSLLATVVEARRRETDSWVQSALDRVLQAWNSDVATFDSGQAWISVPADAELEDIRAEAIQTVSRILLHETRPLVGALAEIARAEIADYEGSGTATAINRLRAFLETIQRLEQASAAPRYGELDITDLIARVIASVGYSQDQVVATRTDPLISVGDEDLISIALSNVIRNAVEATRNRRPVVVNSSVTDVDAWIVVLDEGVGLPAAVDKVWEPGRTTKSKDTNFGWGLSIAQRAVHSLGGTIQLTPRTPTGTSCEIRWNGPVVQQ